MSASGRPTDVQSQRDGDSSPKRLLKGADERLNLCPSAAAARMGCSGGGTGIRTPERVSPLTVFKTAAFDRSAIPPQDDNHPTGSITSSPPMYPRSTSGITTDPSRC